MYEQQHGIRSCSCSVGTHDGNLLKSLNCDHEQGDLFNRDHEQGDLFNCDHEQGNLFNSADHTGNCFSQN